MRKLLLVAPLLLAGCTTGGGGSPTSIVQLTEGSWRLSEFQSSDDSIGTKRPGPEEVYELSFRPDGMVAARIACNRGSGKWTSESSSATGGQLSFGPIATTMMACVNATMDGQVARDMGNVVSYTMRDGALYLALKADAGIYKFVRAPQPR